MRSWHPLRVKITKRGNEITLAAKSIRVVDSIANTLAQRFPHAQLLEVALPGADREFDHTPLHAIPDMMSKWMSGWLQFAGQLA